MFSGTHRRYVSRLYFCLSKLLTSITLSASTQMVLHCPTYPAIHPPSRPYLLSVATEKPRFQLRKSIFLVNLKPFVLRLHKCLRDCAPSTIFQSIYVDAEHHVARPVRKTKPTATLLQHAEQAALPSQTKAINEFHAAEAAKCAAEHTSTSSTTEITQSPPTSPIPSAPSVKCALRHNLLFREPQPSSLVELDYLDDNDEEAEADAETGDVVDGEEAWDMMLLGDDAEDVSDVEMDV
ncbi:uncharacterized protein HD556DRAFT_1527592 [Suillus plorans]|uniref:Uncharacterized protein n=1 Tax=Suillus plorans TaxID=116603 RepID=A0A9P7AQJ3_9AGAM|nr:uncharacterized protein HD556DRAFT_1527592 [Suillus plorans]KAG1793356.1 hypothetical protein HD556DRAFT_1527592 [Suillus plorans]